MKINILALDSTSSICGVSLLSSDQEQHQLTSAQHEGSSQHAEQMLPLIEQTLEQAAVQRNELSALAFAQGPGGFTGLRVACGVAQGIAYALGLKVAPISSLLAIAAQQTRLTSANPIELVVVDARMQELYLGAYQRTESGWYSLHKPVLIGLEQLHHYIALLKDHLAALQQTTPIRISGDALVAFEGLQTALIEQGLLFGNSDLARSETIAELGLLAYQNNQLIEPDLAAPIYVRNRVAFTIAEREQGFGGNPSADWHSVAIRPMTTEDVAAVASIEQTLQLQAWSQEALQSSLTAGHWAWVATFADEVVAYVLMAPVVDEAEMLLIGVAPDHQRRGIAQQLLCYAEQAVRAAKVIKIHLEVRQSNLAARELYQGADYYPVGLRKNYYLADNNEREHAVLYTKHLA